MGTCECGHADDEHDVSGECMIDGCGCDYYDELPDEDNDDA